MKKHDKNVVKQIIIIIILSFWQSQTKFFPLFFRTICYSKQMISWLSLSTWQTDKRILKHTSQNYFLFQLVSLHEHLAAWRWRFAWSTHTNTVVAPGVLNMKLVLIVINPLSILNGRENFKEHQLKSDTNEAHNGFKTWQNKTQEKIKNILLEESWSDSGSTGWISCN